MLTPKRLITEVREIQKEQKKQKENNETPNFLLKPESSNIYRWKAIIAGPEETPFYHKYYRVDIRCPETYPMKPPTVRFVTPIFHPNIHFKTGEVCLDILKTDWSPAWDIMAICRAVHLLLRHPEPSSPLNCFAGNILRSNDHVAYNSMGKMYAEIYGYNSFEEAERK
ncbi:aminoacyltransferase [Anaeramoeba flamelloides]|uniref:Aminoacyltransferase n=1 Tax=Anaeramoeba flamelloides TaxID=1746091 RepID=A0AAV7Y577_9EUKA|nr:aminoacyltransferase e1 ubiquitin-activating enzyme-related [Anaeramoeba flamelloides]KAJ6234765.1 aminoacyltransferase [Anaeramoeba flamelloides]